MRALIISCFILTSCAAVSPPEKPRLVVVISFDQLRGDMVTRNLEHFGSDGFARIIREGARYDSCFFTYANTSTGPGHAVIGTGCDPRTHGVVANDLCDRSRQRCFYCANDTAGNPSPFPLLKPTVGERLRATDPLCKVVGIGLKDRSVILMSGHNATACVWFDPSTLRYTSQGEYSEPAWLDDANRRYPIAAYTRRVWDTTDLKGKGARDDAPWEQVLRAGSRTFPHMMPAEEDEGFAYDVQNAPFSMENVFDVSMWAIEAEGLGLDDHPDILNIGVSTTDYAGHTFGPDSREMQEMLIHADDYLATFIDFLDDVVGREHYRLIVTSDHGVAPVPELLLTSPSPDVPPIDAGRIDPGRLRRVIDSTLTANYGDPSPRSWIMQMHLPFIYLDPATARERGVAIEDLADTVKRCLLTIKGIETIVTREEMMSRGMPNGVDPQAYGFIARSFHPDRSADVMVYPKRYWVISKATAAHQSYHDYDRWVELMVLGAGRSNEELSSNSKRRAVSPADIAPTIAAWLGIDLGDVDGRPLP